MTTIIKLILSNMLSMSKEVKTEAAQKGLVVTPNSHYGDMYSSFTVWMANPTVLDGITLHNGAEITLEKPISLDELMVVSQKLAFEGITMQVLKEDGSYYASYVTGSTEDGLLCYKNPKKEINMPKTKKERNYGSNVEVSSEEEV